MYFLFELKFSYNFDPLFKDTMVAMQALSKYSVRVSKEDNDLKLSSVFGDSEQNNFALNEDNLLLVQKQKLETLSPEGENTINFKVKGKGCFMLQTVLRYNVWQSPDKTSFNMTAEQVNTFVELEHLILDVQPK
jgi:hypothetical protein